MFTYLGRHNFYEHDFKNIVLMYVVLRLCESCWILFRASFVWKLDECSLRCCLQFVPTSRILPTSRKTRGSPFPSNARLVETHLRLSSSRRKAGNILLNWGTVLRFVFFSVNFILVYLHLPTCCNKITHNVCINIASSISFSTCFCLWGSIKF